MSDAMPSSMKILLGLGLLTLLLPSALPLSCYVCSTAPTNEQCNRNNQTCPALENRCLTIIDIRGSSRTISKQCATASTCTGVSTTSGLDANGDGVLAECCRNSNLCNVNGAGSISARKALPALSLLVLLGLVAQ
ncbi:ly6/PLAUR domain-containing protein 6-like [Gadus chalcogrammus]|uniref:ly6/PLAUR domain-containing protein 6-like n=1 Tax=Gadus chalcogrammus TaxID=1042646 RepID=UPI0024C433D9|nr:ly6/PLAUR domain-containing protein 6-like [Gadus chalcogrammus]